MRCLFRIAVIHLIVCLCGCSLELLKPATRSSRSVPRITASQAIETARKIIKDPEWQLADLSNTGSVYPYKAMSKAVGTENFRNPDEALMLYDGRAGQWVVGFYKALRLRRILVTAQSAVELPEMEFPGKRLLLKKEIVAALDSARKLAIASARKEHVYYDVISVYTWYSAERYSCHCR